MRPDFAALIALSLSFCAHAGDSAPARDGLDPLGRVHLAIGIPDSVDTLKTFVEAEGGFSPGFATYGIAFWLHDPTSGTLTAPTMAGVAVERGLVGDGLLIPWSAWTAGDLAVRSEVCQVQRASPAGDIQVVAARVHLANRGAVPRTVALYAALRGLGPAGGSVGRIAAAAEGDALLVDDHPAIIAGQRSTAGVAATDSVGAAARAGSLPAEASARSPTGQCSGVLRHELTIAAGATQVLSFVCPVLPGRRAVGHDWQPGGKDNYKENAKPNPATGGRLQGDPGLEWYRAVKADALFAEATAFWKGLAKRVTLTVPDPRWAQAWTALVGHTAMFLNEGAPDVAVINYTTFNRDAVYNIAVLENAGVMDLATRAVDYLLAHPFNGRPYPEADNPGQVLWIAGQHYQFTRDQAWLTQAFPRVRKLAGMITWYRGTPPPHHVSMDGDFGAEVPAAKRHAFVLGRCDGNHPEYTEAFDIAGMRAAADLAEAAGHAAEATTWRALAGTLFEQYDRRFGAKLARDYGSYSVQWPCRLYPLDAGKGREQFRNIAAQKPGGWRYFPPAVAHQGLYAGNRAAGGGTVKLHLDQAQMQDWYVLDEGGDSGVGGWANARTTWKAAVAMPHGWAIAEVALLMRDCLAFEDDGRLVVLAGVAAEWFKDPVGMTLANFPTRHGVLDLRYAPAAGGAVLDLGGVKPPAGVTLRWPATLPASFVADGTPVTAEANGDVVLPVGTKRVAITFAP